ncbi:fimbrial protein [Aeromonas veronii]|uniref:fimbrial protein n=1 Tax=Aeromonas veronii TaxID=654 RepID=UPI001FD63958|nr:fimbrial protein [Aeromonas veronii]MCJ8220299.1 fimbrial protein [Aeromonas veronii]
MKAQHTASRLVRKTVLSVSTSLLLGTALLPSTASAADGSVTFTGTIYETPCDFSDSSVTCYSGMNKQTMPLAHLQQAGQISSISSTISYKVTNASNMAIVTVSYL